MSTAAHLTEWASHLAPPPRGCSFLNFTASHDGIGVRPLEGILSQEEILDLAEKVEARGGLVSMRSLEDGSEVPYELNTTFFGALAEPEDDAVGEARFLVLPSCGSCNARDSRCLFSFSHGNSKRYSRV